MKAKLSLSELERSEVQKFVHQGKTNARTLTRAWTLLKLADGWDEAQIAETFAISLATVKNVAHRFAEGGLDLVLHDKVQHPEEVLRSFRVQETARARGKTRALCERPPLSLSKGS